MLPDTSISGPIRLRGGFTLLEMLIVGMLGVLVVTFMCNAARWYARSVQEINVSSRLTGELKLAAEAIAQDFGRSISTQTSDGSDLQFDYDGNGDSSAQWGTPDTVIQYALVGNLLVRRDLAAGTEIPMARHITAITVSGDASDLSVNLAAGYRNTVQDLNLSLPNP